MTPRVHYWTFLAGFLSLVHSQTIKETTNQQDRLLCLGVRCPTNRPRCIAENQIAKCVPLESTNTHISGTTQDSNSRLSRRPHPAFSSSFSRPTTSSASKPKNSPRAVASSDVKSSQSTISDRVPSFCFDSPQKGRCRAYFPRFYYDQKSGKCRRFVYGGCGGNQNRFQNQRGCKRTCEHAVRNSGFDVGLDANRNETQINKSPGKRIPYSRHTIHGSSSFAKGAPPALPRYCLENAETGPCFALFPRYYYNKNTGKCESFNYGGCGGNRNNFRSMKACKRSCGYIDYYVDRQSNGNNIPQGQSADILPSNIPNNEPSLPKTAETSQTSNNPCLLPKKIGPCRALIPRFFYNSLSKRCEQFGFGGCKPNENNFRSERECKRRCLSPKFNKLNQIFVNRKRNNNENTESDSTPKGLLTEFNPTDSIAFREFLIRQQMSNDIEIINPILSSSLSGFYVCAQPLDPGTCNMDTSSYYFNGRTRSCQHFIFHGCGGNQNRFASLKTCQDTCMRALLRNQMAP